MGIYEVLRLANTTAALVCRSKYGRFLGQNIIVNVRNIAIFGNLRECSEKNVNHIAGGGVQVHCSNSYNAKGNK